MMRIAIAADHGAFALKGQLEESLRSSGYEVVDFGAHELNPADDYPDFIIPLARAVAWPHTSAVRHAISAACQKYRRWRYRARNQAIKPAQTTGEKP